MKYTSITNIYWHEKIFFYEGQATRQAAISGVLRNKYDPDLYLSDEIPNSVFQKLSSNKKLKLVPLPPSSDDPKDENTPEFKKVLEEEKLVNENYLKSIEDVILLSLGLFNI